jgi:hypothetical protein
MRAAILRRGEGSRGHSRPRRVPSYVRRPMSCCRPGPGCLLGIGLPVLASFTGFGLARGPADRAVRGERAAASHGAVPRRPRDPGAAAISHRGRGGRSRKRLHRRRAERGGVEGLARGTPDAVRRRLDSVPTGEPVRRWPPATRAQLNAPASVATDAAGAVYVVRSGHRRAPGVRPGPYRQIAHSRARSARVGEIAYPSRLNHRSARVGGRVGKFAPPQSWAPSDVRSATSSARI